MSMVIYHLESSQLNLEMGFRCRSFLIELDNVRDHRAGISDHPIQNHAQVRLRVHHIVILQILVAFAARGLSFTPLPSEAKFEPKKARKSRLEIA